MRTLIKGGTLVDGTGAAPRNATSVGIENGRIKAVDQTGQFGSDWSGGDVRVIDCDGKWVLPGLINIQDHLMMRDVIGNPLVEVEAGVPRLLLNGIRNSLTALRRGWTTVRDMAAPSGLAIAVRDMINDGRMPGPRVIACGLPICVTGGHAWPVCSEADGADAVRKAAREQFKVGADYIKVMASHDPVVMPGPQQTIPEMTLDEIRAAFEEAKLRGKHTACHVMGTTAITNVLDAGVDILSHGFYLDAQLAGRMAQQDVYLDPTLSSYGVQTISPRRQRGEQWIRNHEPLIEPMFESFEAAVRAGVKMTVGTDTGGIYAEDLALMREHGLSAMDTIVAATKNGADGMLLGDDLGTVEQGKIADIVILNSDPLADPYNIEDVHIVVKDGHAMQPDEIDLDDKDFLVAVRG